MMRRAPPFLLGLALTLPAWAGVDVMFVRSDADCERNGCGLQNGSSRLNAWRTFAGPAYGASDGTANVVDPEDILVLCSEDFGPADVDTATVMIAPNNNISGTSTTARTRWTGDCSPYGGPKMAKVNGGGTIDRGFDVGSTNRQYIQIDNIEFYGFDQYGIINQGLATDADYWLVEANYIHDIRGLSSDCWFGRGSDVSLVGNRFDRCGQDNVYHEGDRFVFRSNKASNPGMDAAGTQGDNLQYGTTEAEGFDISENLLSSQTDVKQCAIVGVNGSPTSGILTANQCDGPSATAALHSAFFLQGTGTVIAQGNYAKESRYLIYAASGVKLIGDGNIGHDLSEYGIQCGPGATDCELTHNTVARVPVCFSTESASGTSKIANNIGADCTTAGIRKNAGDTETGNDLYRVSSMVENETTPTAPSASTVTTAPGFVGGTQPNTVNGFRLLPTSPLCGAGVYAGKYFDKTGRRILPPVTPGAFQCSSGRAPALR